MRSIVSLCLVAVLCSIGFAAYAQDEPQGVVGALLTALPVILLAVVPPIVRVLRATVAAKVPSSLIPVVVPIGAAVVTVIANQFGLDLGITMDGLASAQVGVWESVVTGLVIGLGGVGVHQIKKNLVDKPKA